MNLPTPRQAFNNAKSRPRPKASQKYLHPIVYYAGADTGWHMIYESMESEIYPIFKSHYEALCRRVEKGEEFRMPHESPLVDRRKFADLKNEHRLYGK